MGLDMYIYKTTKDRVVLDDNLLISSFNHYEDKMSDSLKAELELEEDDDEDDEESVVYEEFFYWRKHPAIHDWMENLYFERGGKGTFNGIPLLLRKEDLKRLKKDVVKKNLNYDAQGFFFGNSRNPNTQEGIGDLKRDLNFISLALKEIRNDQQVVFVYDSSW